MPNISQGPLSALFSVVKERVNSVIAQSISNLGAKLISFIIVLSGFARLNGLGV
jgi:hypothetical protein